MANEVYRSKIRWADSISCVAEDNAIWLFGDIWQYGSVDLMEAYEREEVRPHVQFANSSSREQVLSFTEHWGPAIIAAGTEVAPQEHVAELPLDVDLDRADQGSPINPVAKGFVAYVTWEELRAEQRFYAALLDATHIALDEDRGALKQRQTAIRSRRRVQHALKPSRSQFEAEALQPIIGKLTTIVQHTKSWEEQLKREQQARSNAEYVLSPNWEWDSSKQESIELAVDRICRHQAHLLRGVPPYVFDSDPIGDLKLIITTILDAFPPRLQWIFEHVEEVPHDDLLFGIRPVLMTMLRRDVLLKREVRMCIRDGCGRYFVATRSDKRCCSAKCTERVNNRRQYQFHTKPRRQRAANTKRKQKG